ATLEPDAFRHHLVDLAAHHRCEIEAGSVPDRMMRDRRIETGVARVEDLGDTDVDSKEDALHVAIRLDVDHRVRRHRVASRETRAPIQDLLQSHLPATL